MINQIYHNKFTATPRSFKNIIYRARYSLMFFGLILSMHIKSAYGVHVTIINDSNDIVLNKKIWLRFTLSHHEHGIFKNSLQFSVDHPDIHLTSWHHMGQVDEIFLPSFKKTKKLFIKSFDGYLSIQSQVLDDELRRLLIKSAFYVSCLVANNDGENKLINCMIPFNVTKKKELISEKELPSIPIVNAQQQSTTIIEFQSVPDLEKEFNVIDHLGQMWHMAIEKAVNAINKTTFFWWYLMVGCMFLILIFIRKYCLFQSFTASPFIKELTKFFGFLLFLGAIIRFCPGAWLAHQLYTLAALCSIAWIYIIFSTSHEEYFWGRLKSLIGFLLGVIILPLMLVAYLVQHGFY